MSLKREPAGAILADFAKTVEDPFMIRRFDRTPEGGKFHTQTLGGSLRMRRESTSARSGKSRARIVLIWICCGGAELRIQGPADRKTRTDTYDASRFFDRHRDAMNERQTRAMERMFREGWRGFAGGMTAKKYMAITKCPPATATRDLSALAAMGALISKGGGRSTRYEIAPSRPTTDGEPELVRQGVAGG